MSRFRSVSLVAATLAMAFCNSFIQAKDEPAKKMPSSVVPSEKDRGRHEQFLKDKADQLKKGPIEVVFIGDSITDGWRIKTAGPREGGRAVWDKNFAKYNALNLGISGDRTQHLLWRIAHGELDGLDPKAVVMMIGTNNHESPADEIIAGVKADIAAIQKKLPKTKILLLAVFPRDMKPKTDNRTKLAKVNAALAELDGKDNVKYLDIGPKFLEADGTLPKSIMPDALHPNEKGYGIWAEAMGPTLDELVK